MMKLSGGLPRIYCMLFFAGWIVPLWFLPAMASDLKDIRVGEYKGFTRIVFEFSSPTLKPVIRIQSSNQLLVTFRKTDVNLIRKIPVKPSPHVKDLQFWQRKDDVSTVLSFDYPYFRFESFKLSRPARYAVDIFPVVKPAKETVSSLVAPDQIDKEKNAAEQTISQVFPNDGTLSSPEKTETESGEPQYGEASNLPEADDPKTKLAERKTLEDDAKESTSITEKQGPSPTEAGQPPTPETGAPSELTDVKQGQTPKKSSPIKNPLQFYLVVILVFITIVILLLLLFMLITRHHIFGGNISLGSVDGSQDQYKKIIAELDHKIKKQRQHLDEA